MKKNVKKICIVSLISISVSIILNFIFIKINNNISKFIFDRILIIFVVIEFIGFHFAFGIKSFYEYIIKNRYIISAIMLVLLTILSYSGSSMGVISDYIFENNSNTILGKERKENTNEYSLETLYSISQKQNNNPFMNSNLNATDTDMFTYTNAPVKDVLILGKIANIGYLFLKSDMAYSFWWNFRLIALLLVSFELCMIITNKNKFYSLAGAIIIAFSSAIQWKFTYSMVDVIIFGQLMPVLLNLFMKEQKIKNKFFLSLAFSLSLVSYLFTFDIRSIIGFGYAFLGLAIWIIIKNVKEVKFNKKDLLFLLIPIFISALFLYRYYLVTGKAFNLLSVEEATRNSNGFSLLFSYIYNIFLPFKEIKNSYYFSNIISIFPIPILICFWYLYKKDEHMDFLFPMAVVTTLEIIQCMSGFPSIIANITLFKYVTVEIAVLTVGFLDVYLFLYILSNIKERIFNIKQAIRITLITVCLIVFINKPTEISSMNYLYIFSLVYCLLAFLLLKSNEEKYRRVFLFFAVAITIINSFSINPITKGTSVITTSEIAKKIKSLSENEKDAIWISEGDSTILANYAVANNVKVLNTTSICENEELFVKALGKEKAKETKDIWNRFANIEIQVDSENNVKLKENSKSTIILSLTREKLKELNVKYIISYSEENKLEEKGLNLECVYKKSSENPIEINGENKNQLSIYEVL